MARIRRDEKQLSLKIVYAGAAESGKSTTLATLHSGLSASSKSPLTTSVVTAEPTCFFEIQVPEMSLLPGYSSSLQVLTVPGHVEYRATLVMLLQGADGIVFVVDSAADRHAANLAAWIQLQAALHDAGMTLNDIAVVFQYNKADQPGAVPIQSLDAFYNAGPVRFPSYQTNALQGIQLTNVFTAVSQAAAGRLAQRLHELVEHSSESPQVPDHSPEPWTAPLAEALPLAS